jgi:hypothetical protein
MRVANPLHGPGLLARTMRVSDSQVLDLPADKPPAPVASLGGVPILTPLALGLPAGTLFSVAWNAKLPNPLVPSPAAAPSPAPARTPVTLAHVTKNVGIGLGLAGTTMTVMPLAHATTTKALSAQLTGYGFPPATSQNIAQQGLDFARSHAGQLTTLFIAGSAVGVGVVEAVRPDLPWPHKILAGSVLGLALVAVAGWGIHKGWWGYDATPKAAPAVARAASAP